MATGLGVLRLPPGVFWAMTPKELAAAVRGLTGAVGASSLPTRAELEALMIRFPDRA